MVTNYENKRLIGEIILILLFLIMVVPLCVNASSNYNKRKNELNCINNISIDIGSNGNDKVIKLNNLDNREDSFALVLKISKFSNKYVVKLDDVVYNLNDMNHTEDSEYYYYNLGVYKIKKYKEFKFSLILIENNNYDDNIMYSFMTEDELC